MSEHIVEAYRKLREQASTLGASAGFAGRSQDYVAGIWKYDDDLLSLVPGGVAGKVVLDFGAKYGHTIPLLLERGATHVIGIDVEDEYLADGRRIFSSLYSNIQFCKSERGFMPVQRQTVDVLIANEVISHINPMFLDTFYAEAARVLRPGGHIIISDGNNLANESMHRSLPDLWDAWENGPAGRATERDVVAILYIDRRRGIIRRLHPDLPDDKVEYVAQNTSGLFGDQLAEVINGYVATAELIERPYRYGTCPTNPSPAGVVMERPFHPEDVIRSLAAFRVEARQVFHPQYAEELRQVTHWTRIFRGTWRPDLTGAFSMFQVLGLNSRSQCNTG